MTDGRINGGGRSSRNLTYGMLDSLGRAIVTGRFRDRPFPTEAELAKSHGVSRSVTREAMKMLAAKGLVSARPRQGTAVRPSGSWNLFDPDVLRWLLERQFSVDLLRHFTQLRLAIEPEAAALAARHAEPADRELIRAGLERMEAAERGRDDTLDADIAFHVAVLNASKNPFYAQFRDVVATALMKSIRFTNSIKGHSASIAEHQAVLDAVLAGDAARARDAMRLLIANVLQLIEGAEPDGMGQL
ncbi:FadR/GntR family transcriptional regulator [Sphingomonas lenta]|uniref:FadR family transcriptional regulator n=1 Tax=Sphingomonas lenta TaxID=1141887 RepID=A0A2A2SGC6_9SPHN|nr:FadR/GntR family transcriptional regulator [Sphingomonas lenta]PAX08071.1 FadR family transcriptional regulator [Sphingomonas lenta]